MLCQKKMWNYNRKNIGKCAQKKSAAKHAATCFEQVAKCFTMFFLLTTSGNFFKAFNMQTGLLSLHIALKQFQKKI